MHRVDPVEKGHGLGHLLEDSPRCRLSNYAIGDGLRILLERDSFHVVGDDVDLFWCVDQVVQLNYTGVL